MEQLNEAIIKVGPFWSILIEPAEGMGFLLRSQRAQNCQMTKISARSAAVRLTQFVGLLFGDVSSEWKKDNWLVESSNISGNISCWWHMILHFHPGNFSMEPENTPRKEEENHLNQTIICWFNVNLRVFFVLLDVCLFHSLQFGSNWCDWLGDTSSCVDTWHFGHFKPVWPRECAVLLYQLL